MSRLSLYKFSQKVFSKNFSNLFALFLNKFALFFLIDEAHLEIVQPNGVGSSLVKEQISRRQAGWNCRPMTSVYCLHFLIWTNIVFSTCWSFTVRRWVNEQCWTSNTQWVELRRLGESAESCAFRDWPVPKPAWTCCNSPVKWFVSNSREIV